MDEAAEEVFGVLYGFALQLGYDAKEADKIALLVMAEYGPIDEAAAAPGSEARARMILAIEARPRPRGAPK